MKSALFPLNSTYIIWMRKRTGWYNCKTSANKCSLFAFKNCYACVNRKGLPSYCRSIPYQVFFYNSCKCCRAGTTSSWDRRLFQPSWQIFNPRSSLSKLEVQRSGFLPNFCSSWKIDQAALVWLVRSEKEAWKERDSRPTIFIRRGGRLYESREWVREREREREWPLLFIKRETEAFPAFLLFQLYFSSFFSSSSSSFLSFSSSFSVF